MKKMIFLVVMALTQHVFAGLGSECPADEPMVGEFNVQQIKSDIGGMSTKLDATTLSMYETCTGNIVLKGSLVAPNTVKLTDYRVVAVGTTKDSKESLTFANLVSADGGFSVTIAQSAQLAMDVNKKIVLTFISTQDFGTSFGKLSYEIIVE